MRCSHHSLKLFSLHILACMEKFAVSFIQLCSDTTNKIEKKGSVSSIFFFLFSNKRKKSLYREANTRWRCSLKNFNFCEQKTKCGSRFSVMFDPFLSHCFLLFSLFSDSKKIFPASAFSGEDNLDPSFEY